MVAPSARKQMAQEVTKTRSISARRSCKLFSISLTCWRYSRKNDPENDQIARQLMILAQQHTTWGFQLMFLHLRNVQGHGWNHKRVYRIYCQLRLNLRIKPKQRLVREKPQKLQAPSAPNTVWSMDFMHDQLSDGRSYRSLNVMDDYNRELLCAEIDIALPAQRVIRALEQVIEYKGLPKAIRSDNGPEYISHALADWAKKRGIALWFIQPGNPQQNAYIERFNRTMRYELLSTHLFGSVGEVQLAATRWQWTYNHDRPHMALGGITPAQKLAAYFSNHLSSTKH